MGRYTDIEILKNNQGKRYYATTKYPQIPLDYSDIYVYSTQGDRFDILAQQYYGNSSLWWIISIANESLTQGSYYIPEGAQIRIPTNIGKVLSQYQILNEL